MSPDVRLPLRSGRARLGFAMLLTGVALAPVAHAAQPSGVRSPSFRNADYFAVADRIVAALPTRWDADEGVYVARRNGSASRTNANLLLLHAVAALRGHTGPTRRDERARRLVDRMTHRPMFLLPGPTPVHGRTVCWARRVNSSERDHVSLDSQVAEALSWAWKARRALGLTPAAARRVVAAVDRCARHPGWRFPALLVNQFNWNAQLYASAARVTGHGDLLRRDYHAHLARFASGITRALPGMLVPNLGPGYGFHYSPHRPASVGLNFDAPEYANIVATALEHYAPARSAGMRALPARSVGLLRAWVTRLLAGSWTHAGYLNWDTGHGWRRWHSAQYWAFAQQGPLAIASAPRFWARPEYGSWAKALFDRGLLLYERWAREGGGIAAQNPFDVRSEHRDHDLYLTRIAANAARALVLGLGATRAADPPPLYAYDHETGRLAVTTPRYSTAIVPSNRGAFPYGGIDLARLYGPGHRVAANIGGEPPSTFGVIVRDGVGHEVLASQHAKLRTGRLRITRSPRGRIARPRRYPSVPYAGPFRALDTRGTIARGNLRITTTNRFRRDRIDVRWDVRCSRGCGPFTVDVQLPTWSAQGGRDRRDAAGREPGPAGRAGRRPRPHAGAGRHRAHRAGSRAARRLQRHAAARRARGDPAAGRDALAADEPASRPDARRAPHLPRQVPAFEPVRPPAAVRRLSEGPA